MELRLKIAEALRPLNKLLGGQESDKGNKKGRNSKPKSETKNNENLTKKLTLKTANAPRPIHQLTINAFFRSN